MVFPYNFQFHGKKQPIVWNTDFLSVCKIGLTGFLLLSQTVTQLILITCEFQSYKFASSTKFICNPRNNTGGALRVTCRHAQMVRNLSGQHDGPSWQRTRRQSAFLFSSHSTNKCPFQSLFSAIFSHFCAFLGDFVVYNAPGHGAEVRSHVPKHKKAVMSLNREKRVRQASFRHELVMWATRSMLMNQQNISNKVSLYRNTHKYSNIKHNKQGYVLAIWQGT